MMFSDSEIEQLLSAYLRGDVSAEERTAVESRLARDPQFKATAQEMTELMALLKSGERRVSQPLSTRLNERLTQKISAQSEAAAAQSLLAASLTGDVSADESKLVQQMISKDPHAARELQSLKTFSATLKRGERSVSDAMSQQLLERLQKKLPAAAFRPAPVAAVPMAAAVSTRSAPVSLRVFAAPENPWRKRALVAAAAAVMLALGVSAAVKFMSVEPGRGVANGPQPVEQKSVELSDNKKVVPDEKIEIAPPDSEVVHGPEAPHIPAPGPQNNPAPVVKNNPGVATQDTPPKNPAPQQKLPQDPKIVDNKPAPHIAPPHDVAPQDNPVVQTPQDEPKTPPPLIKDPSDPNKNPQVADVVKNPNGVGTTVMGVGPSTNNPTVPQTAMTNPGTTVPPVTDSANDPIEPKDGVAVVGAVLASVEATADGKTSKLSQRMEVPSDSTVSTGGGEAALVLPDGTKLYLNKGARINLSLHGKTATVTLVQGELHYRGSGGNVTVSWNTTTVRNGADINVKLQDNQLIVSNVEKNVNAVVAVNGKTVAPVKPLTQSVYSASGATEPIKTVMSETPGKWTADLKLPGEGTGTDTKAPSNEGRARAAARKKR